MTKKELIKGQFYVGEWEYDNKVIFKYEGCLEKPTHIITSDKKYYFSREGCCTSTDINFRLATTQEQRWLEACIRANETIDLEDITPKFEIDKWYLASYNDSPHYIKCKNFTESKFYYEEYIFNGIHEYSEGSSNILNMGDIKEVSLNQIQPYLPKEHPDKLSKRISFYVRYTSEFTEDLYNKLVEWSKENSTGKPRGWRDTYEGLKYNGYYLFDNYNIGDFTDIRNYGVDNNPQECQKEISVSEVKSLIGYNELKSEELKKNVLNEKTEIMESYIGRYVKALIDNPNGGIVPKGSYGLIVEQESNGHLKISFPTHMRYLSLISTITNKTSYEIMPIGWKPEKKIKVGDKVRFINPNSSNAKYFRKGLENLEVYYVGEKSYDVWESDKSTKWNVDYDEVELMEDIKPSEYVCLPMPEKAVKIRLIKDLYKKDIYISGNLPKFIPKGSITWINVYEDRIGTEGVVCPERNRYSANIPGYYFEFVDNSSAKTTVKYKFNVGDKVRIIKSGSGCSPECINEVVTIIEQGIYTGENGYKITPTKASSNAITGSHNGFIGEDSFELYVEKEWKPSVGDWVVITKSSENWNEYMNDFVGLVLKIKNINERTTEFHDPPNKLSRWCWVFYDNHYRKAEPYEIPVPVAVKKEPLLETSKSNSMDSLLIIANNKYPKGTYYLCAETNKKTKVEGDFKDYSLTSGKAITDGHGGYVYFKGKWATIVGQDYVEPKLEGSIDSFMEKKLEEVKQKYTNGTIFNSLGGNYDVEVTSNTNFYISDYEIKGKLFKKHSTAILYRKSEDKWAEIISSSEVQSVETEDLLQRARLLYPKGTVIISLQGRDGVSCEETIREDMFFKFYEDGSISSLCLSGYLYHKGEWATIINDSSSVDSYIPTTTKKEITLVPLDLPKKVKVFDREDGFF